MNLPWKWIVAGIATLVVAGTLAWVLLPVQNQPSTLPTGNSNIPSNTTVNTNVQTSGTNVGTNTAGSTVSQQKVFKISDGPVAGATFVQTFHPTTTLARYVMADNGHMVEIVIDSPGAIEKSVTNTTIPGPRSTLWVESGGAALLQYLNGTLSKTVYLGAPATSSAPVRLQFYPDGIISLAAAPGGARVAYLLQSAGGVTGYSANPDGTGGKQLFSLPLSQIQLRWPSPGTLLAYSNSAAGVPGIAFAIDASSGVVTPLVYAPGLTATADQSFSTVMYQTATQDSRTTYAHSVKTGADRPLSFGPFPEKCIASPQSGSVLYCAAPLAYVEPNFLDQWHAGTASAADSLLSFNIASGTSTILATPGSSDGGVPTDMLSIAVSPDGRYGLFVSKYDRSLWGIRLAQ